ncbi:MAG: response regulator, partial [Myxococcota bacterium]
MVDDRGATRRPIRVLVVDDQPSMRLLMRTLLERDGCVVEESSDGLDALGRLTPALDVVVMDVMMPGLDGISTVRRLRELDRTLPVVLVTALADREARVAGKAAGADDFLTKPIDAAELCARVRVLGQTKALTDRVASERTRLAELEVAQDAVARLERLATLGTLAAGVGHELKNLAMVVQGVGLELSEGDPAEDAPSMLERVGRHLASLGQHLMRLGNDRIGDVEPVDVGLVVRQVHELLTRAGRLSGTTAVVEIDPTCGPAHANALELEQVLINLLGNAIDAVDGRELRRIGVGVEPAEL